MAIPDAPVVIAHLSDLHLGSSALDSGTSSKADVKSVWKTRRLAMQTHDPFILCALETELKIAARVAGASSDQFDLYVITGDISTNATTAERFAFARAFLTSQIPLGTSLVGLRIDNARILCVPGNHDKLWETSLDRYLSAFRDLPSPTPFVVHRTTRNGRVFSFFGIDSNLYEEGNIAVGRISPETLGWLSKALNAWAGPPDAVRILLLHHHPADLNRFRKRSLFSRLGDRFTVLDEGERLLTLCRGRIDVIMHGHEHFPVAFEEEHSGCIVVSAGTTMEWQTSDTRVKNSFHALTFEGKSLRVVPFAWSGARFEPGSVQHEFRLPCANE